MRRNIFHPAIATLILLVIMSFQKQDTAPTLQDIKDAIKENVSANPPLPNYQTYIFFQNDILQNEANNFVCGELTDDIFSHILMFGTDMMTEDKTLYWGSAMRSTDIRGITKVSTTHHTGDQNYFSINLYLSGNYLAKERARAGKTVTCTNIINKMEITIGNNPEVALKIKREIIKLGTFYNLEIKDGDAY